MFERNKVIFNRWLLLLAGALLLACMMPGRLLRASAAEQTPEAVTITGKVTSDEDMPKDTEFVLRISADKLNPQAPLPQITQVMVRKSGEFVFGPISLPEIGDYYYTITEEAGGSAGVTYDPKTVSVCVSVRYGEDDKKKVESITVSNDAWVTKHEGIEFINSYEPGQTDAPETESKDAQDSKSPKVSQSSGGGASGGSGAGNVKTGDDTPVTALWLLLAASGAAVLALAGRKRYTGKRQKS